jgi:hypothetical protein
MSDMRPHPQEELTPYIAKLKELPFVEDARIVGFEQQPGQYRGDATVEIRAGRRTHRLLVEHKRTTRLDYGLVAALRNRLAHTKAKWILFAPFVTAQMARHLQKLEINFVDLAGNCRLILDDDHVAIIEGRRPTTAAEDTRGLGPAGFKVLFALLARQELLQANVREVAAKAGVGKTAAATTIARLVETGAFGHARGKTIVLRPKEALDQWIMGYRALLRPRLLLGRYQTPELNPIEFERRVEPILEARDDPQPARKDADLLLPTDKRWWAWGGTAAAYRLTGHYRGETTILHAEGPIQAVPQRFRVLPARTGNLTILRAPGPLAFDGALPRTAHPLLIYAELLLADDDRAREAATEIHDRFLTHLL